MTISENCKEFESLLTINLPKQWQCIFTLSENTAYKYVVSATILSVCAHFTSCISSTSPGSIMVSVIAS